MADEIEFVCNTMIDRGADKVIWSTYPHTYEYRLFCENGPAVVREFNSRDHGHVGVDLVTPTNERNADVHPIVGIGT